MTRINVAVKPMEIDEQIEKSLDRVNNLINQMVSGKVNVVSSYKGNLSMGAMSTKDYLKRDRKTTHFLYSKIK